MEKNSLQQLIEKEIQAVAFEYLKDLQNTHQAKSTDDYLQSKSLSEEDIDNVLFYGGQPKKDEKKTGPITIKENVEGTLKITMSEIKDFENSFKAILDNIPGASIVFDKQKNGYSISATKRADGVEAKASGIINLGGNGKLIWVYSILNGFILNAQNLKLDEGNKIMFEALYNHYNDWQKKWRELLNLPQAPEAAVDAGASPVGGAEQTIDPMGGQGDQAPQAVPGPGAPTTPIA